MSPSLALVFRLKARTFAVDAAEVAGVARRPPLSRVPHAPAALAGIGAFEGRAMPVMELARLLDDGEGGGDRVLLLRGGEPAAVAVDFVEGIREASRVSCEWLDLRAIIAPVFQHSARPSRRVFASDAQSSAADVGRECGLLAFALAGQSLAFPVEQVRAVLREPAEMIAVPGADPVVVGLSPYRDGVLPVVELARLIDLPAPPPGRHVRLFVVAIAGAPVGLRVERALGVLRIAQSCISPAPAALNRGAGEARVSAIARTPSGLVAVLAADRLFDEETMRRLQAVAAPAAARAAVASEPQDSVVVFRVGEDRYALPVEAVEAVAAPGLVSSAPKAPGFLAGVMPHRGAALPVLDARLRFGVAPAARGVVIVVRRGGAAAGLWVDAVERLAHWPRSALAAAPALAGDAGALLAGLSTQDAGRPLPIVDADALLAQARRDVAASPRARARRQRA
jgi:purine-binding chemotaxis protein CheW